jgi:hypothetical protein
MKVGVRDLMDGLHLVPVTREHAYPLQFLVGKVRHFLLAGAFDVAQS